MQAAERHNRLAKSGQTGYLPNSTAKLGGGPLIGSAVGPYQILEKLGAGGMGEVFLGHDPRLERRVALKCLASTASQSGDGHARVLREARAAARLNHPHIAAVYDVLEQADRTFIVMEYVEGISLAARLASGALPPDQVCAIGRQLASALAAAHAQGVIHRDLKPANIQVMRDGSIKVLDFGVARLTTAAPTTADTTSGDAAADQTIGGNPGTPIYMSPEQLCSRPLDARADIYSAGVILFLMATGRRPFQETSAVTLALAMTSGPAPAAAAVNPLVPPDLNATIARALERDPERRFQSARELEAALGGTQGSVPTIAAGHTLPDQTRQVASLGRSLRAWKFAAAAAVVALTIGVASRTPLLTRLGLLDSASAPQRVAVDAGIAVLPLANLSADSSQDYVADGMTEAIIAQLGRVRSLRVISRQSVVRYKGTTVPVPQIARELGVGAIITGSVTRSADRLRVTVSLVQPSPERQLWSETYDRGVGDMLTLAGELAQAAVQHVQAAVTPQEQAQLARARPVNPAVQQAYLLGRFFWNKRSKPDVERAIKEFKRAIELDPGFGPAYAGLADCFVVAWDSGYLSPQEAYREGKANATKALQLDDTIAEAHASLGAVYSFSLLWGPAEQEYRRALALNPGYATAHQWYALNLSVLGRHDEAVAEATRALELDPLSSVQNAFLGQRLYFAGDYTAAMLQLRKALDLNPDLAPAHSLLGCVYLARHQYDDAVKAFDRRREIDGHVSGDLGHAYALAGNRAAALKVLAQLMAARGQRYVDPYQIALVYLGLGDRGHALDWFVKSYEAAETAVTELAVDPRLAPIADDPRFLSLLHKSSLQFNPGRPPS
jgi:serine/threonine protein kinase/TolB-like protein/Tfp pilus assembly protein PilF